MLTLYPLLLSVFAQVTPRPWGLAELLITVIVVCAAFGIAWIAVRESGVPVPRWVFQVVGIVVVAVVCIMAIRLLLSL